MADRKDKRAGIWQRDPDNWYQEPQSVTEFLLSKERFDGMVWDPACGGGNIIRAMIAAGLPAIGSDIKRRGAPNFSGICDFLASAPVPRRPNIVSNPPFGSGGAESFMRRALKTATRKVAMFVDIKFLASGARGRGLWAEHPPSRVWILSDRPSCPPGAWLAAGNKASGGTADWIWVVWDIGGSRETRLGWIAP